MVFREEAGMNLFRPYEKANVGDIIAEGWFEGTCASIFDHDNYLIREQNGEVVEVNYCGHLAHKWKKAKVIVGDYVQIVYDGRGRLEKGKFKGKESHQVKLFRDPDKSLHGTKSAPTSAPQRGPKPAKLQEVDSEDASQDRVRAFADSIGDDDLDI